jgi:hypothetical protein
MTSVYLEVGAQRVFACAFDWPGWCRSGRTAEAALEALAVSAPRYALVTAEAGLCMPAVDFDVLERLIGNATTDFGAPGAIPAQDERPLKAAEAKRLAALVSACWTVFDRVVAAAPAELRKGPRGGGRDRDKIITHILDAEMAYTRQMGLREQAPRFDDAAALATHRAAVVEVLQSATAGGRWPLRYAVRRMGWHVMDHAWEIEDRTP